MPKYMWLTIGIILCIGLIMYCIRKSNMDWLKLRILDVVIFILSLVSFVTSLVLFRNLGVYVNEYGTSPDLVTGGWFWLRMNVVRLVILFVISLISGIRLFRNSKK